MANTFVPIASTVIGAGGASQIEFTGIPGTYTDLYLYLATRTNSNNAGQANIVIRFNGNTTGYTAQRLWGDGTGVNADTVSGTSAGAGTAILLNNIPDATYTSNIFGLTRLYIQNYAGAVAKTVLSDGNRENNATIGFNEINAGTWNNTAAITSITFLIYQAGSNFAQNSSAYLYGISNA